MGDTPILDFIFSCLYAVLFCAAGIVHGSPLYWAFFGAAVAICIFTLPPSTRAMKAARAAAKAKRSGLDYKIIIQSVDHEEICENCGKLAESIAMVTVIRGRSKDKGCLCTECFVKCINDVLGTEDQTEKGGE